MQFSEGLRMYYHDVRKRWKCFCRKSGRSEDVAMLCFTLRTALELLRILYSIPENDFKRYNDAERGEYDLFKIILAINSKIFGYRPEEGFDVSTLVYLNQYATNDINNFDYKLTLRTQLVYAKALFEVLSTDRKCESLYKSFLQKWSVNSWHQYTNTILGIITNMIDFQKAHTPGIHILKTDAINDPDHLIMPSVVEELSIDIHIDISNSPDYKIFRSKPLLKIAEHQYIPFSLQLLTERLYSSLYFNLKDLYVNKSIDNLDYAEFYKRYLLEHTIFHRIMLNCFCEQKVNISYPSKESIYASSLLKEVDSQPDFYIREGSNVLIFECKATKLKGELRDAADGKRLLIELRKKLYNKKIEDNGDEQQFKSVGVTQLIDFIDKAERNEYQWDKPPYQSIYYPVLVLEDSKLIKKGLTTILNRWYTEKLAGRKNLWMYKPLIVLSIDTLFFYSRAFKERGFTHYFEDFYKNFVRDGKVDVIADFNEFMGSEYKGQINFDIPGFVEGNKRS